MFLPNRRRSNKFAAAILLGYSLSVASATGGEGARWSDYGAQAAFKFGDNSFASASQLYEAAVKVAVVERQSPEVIANLLLNQSECQTRLFDFAGAEKSLLSAEQQYLRVHPVNEMLAVRLLRRRVSLLEARDRRADAALVQSELLDKVVGMFGESSRNALDEMDRLANLQWGAHQAKDEVKTSVRCYEGWRMQGVEPSDPRMLDRMLHIGTGMVDIKDYGAALPRLEDAYNDAVSTNLNGLAAEIAAQCYRAYSEMGQKHKKEGDSWLFKTLHQCSIAALSAQQKRGVSAYSRLMETRLYANMLDDQTVEILEAYSKLVDRIAPCCERAELSRYRSQLVLQRVHYLLRTDKLQEAAAFARHQLPANEYDTPWEFDQIRGARVLLANTFESKGDINSALKQYDLLLVLHPKDPLSVSSELLQQFKVDVTARRSAVLNRNAVRAATKRTTGGVAP